MSRASMRLLLAAASLSTAAAFGGIEYLTGDDYVHANAQTTNPPANYHVGFQTQNPDHYDKSGHWVGDYPAQYLVNQAMVDRLPTTGSQHSHDGKGEWYDTGAPWHYGADASQGKTNGAGEWSTSSTGQEYAHGDIDGLQVPGVNIDGGGDRRLSAADADSALLEAAKAASHESLEGTNLDEASLPALMTEV